MKFRFAKSLIRWKDDHSLYTPKLIFDNIIGQSEWKEEYYNSSGIV